MTRPRDGVEPSPVIRLDVEVDGGDLGGFLLLPGGSAQQQEASRPALVVGVHGGPFPPLDEHAARRDATPWLSAGFAFYGVDYRASGGLGQGESDRVLSGEDLPGSGADAGDVRSALCTLRASQFAARVDLDQVVLFGFSYGAYVVNRWVTNPPMPAGVRLAVCLEGVADLRTLDPESLRIQSRRRGSTPAEDPEHWAAASPIERAGAATVPMLLVHGSESGTTGQGRMWRDRLRARGADAYWLECRGEGHVFSTKAKSTMIDHVLRVLRREAVKDRGVAMDRANGVEAWT